MKLEFRAKMPDGKWFNQKMKSGSLQYLPSFLRRVMILHGQTHPKYLEKDLEDYLQIKINGKWIQCHA